MTEILPLLLYFQAVSDRIELEKNLDEEFLLEMNAQGAAMGKARIISWQLKDELNQQKKIKSCKRAKAKTKGSARRLDRPKRKDGKRC